MPMNIAIDGPVGAGKSSIADAVAQKLHILHLDTGAMYRTVALYMLKNGIDPQNEAAVSAHCGEADVRVRYENGEQRTYLGGEDVTGLIRTARYPPRQARFPNGRLCAAAWSPLSAKSRRRRICSSTDAISERTC